MEDKELYDFFKSRKHSFDEVPGDALWTKIESGLNEDPQPQAGKPGMSPLKKLFILPILGAAIAIIWVVAYNPKTGEETAKPQDVNESNSAKIVEDATVHNEYNSTDTIKNVKVPVLQPEVSIITPAPGVLRPTDAVITAKDTLRLKSHAVKMEAVTKGPELSPSTIQLQEIDNPKLKLTDAPTLKPENVVFRGKLIAKDSLNPQAISFKADSVEKEKLREFEIIAVSSSVIGQGQANEVIITPADSLRSDLKVIQTDTKTEPGRVTITVKQSLTKEQFDSFTEKVKRESNHKPGTIIMIIAPGHKTFRYKVPKPVGELGP